MHYLVRNAVGTLIPVNEERRIAGILDRALYGWGDLLSYCLIKPHGDEALLAQRFLARVFIHVHVARHLHLICPVGFLQIQSCFSA